ncbi:MULTISPECIES: isoprenyl transferase [Muribaculum]|uniref:Isoprenyl transferase n=7 Tax=Muribaculum TaxID=1918540 RepID=A0A4P7VM87_9BACT|nr:MULTISPECIES: isoprenyl transferase [Muribaculum]QCD36354.1 isoprenyl transferase [Muribaculum gordoncarteri]TGY04610.1 isoprenyl transferase [Muribaculum sp. NM65_B17]THG44069.1 isoprenyl transferase [Muribaculaceae bacterium]
MSRNHNIDPKRLPRHVAIIMDGNGRWARARGLDRSEGHVEGVNTVRKITEAASEIGIKYLTLYTFSTENWNRPQEEVDALMNLIVIAIERETADLIKNNVRLTMIGDFGRMPDFARRRLSKCMDDTAQCTGLTLVLALSYSSRWEITEAVRNIAAKVQAGSLDPDDITDDTISRNLSTADMPDPDLLIRTGGDFRVSNFLLWQIAYSEIYVTSTYWPDFTKDDFLDALEQFQSRERRFGLTSDQVQQQ